jgi:hypothetical protein
MALLLVAAIQPSVAVYYDAFLVPLAVLHSQAP